MFPNKVLVTGSGGCIGAWVVSQLLKKEVEVVAADIETSNKRLFSLFNDTIELQYLTNVRMDVSNKQRVMDVISKQKPDAIIHLAALQVPFCKAKPSHSAMVNVVGTINILEAARQNGISRISYASSVAASAMPSSNDTDQWLQTLYGAYKVCNEQTANVYWQDWQVPSVGIRPSVVYGVGRDQGLSALPTNALLAACLKRPYNIAFSGDVGFVYTENIANAFIQAIANEIEGAAVYDYNGEACSVEKFVEIASQSICMNDITISGDALPFPSDLSNQPLIDGIGSFNEKDLKQGIQDTIIHFKSLLATNSLDLSFLDAE